MKFGIRSFDFHEVACFDPLSAGAALGELLLPVTAETAGAAATAGLADVGLAAGAAGAGAAASSVPADIALGDALTSGVPAAGGAGGIAGVAPDVLASSVAGLSPVITAIGGAGGGTPIGAVSGASGAVTAPITPATSVGTGASAGASAAPTAAAPSVSTSIGGGGATLSGGTDALATGTPIDTISTNTMSADIGAGAPQDAVPGGGIGPGGGTQASQGLGSQIHDLLFGPAQASKPAVDTGLIGSLKEYTPFIGAAGLGMDLLKGNSALPGSGQISATADQLSKQGQTLQSYLQTGTLPPGVQQSLNSAAESAKAAIRSRYASMGGNTSAMQQDLANVDTMVATQGATIATQLLNTGITETQLSAQLYNELLGAATQQNAQLGSAIGNFATSLAGQPKILQVNAGP